MSLLPFLVALTASVDLAAGEKQVYLIASEPYDEFMATFPTLLYRVDGERLTKVRTVTTQRQDTIFVAAYNELGYVVVASEGAVPGSFLLDVIDLKSVLTHKSYDIDFCAECVYISSYLRVRDGSLTYVLRGSSGAVSRYRGVDLKTGTMSSDFGLEDEGYAYSGAYGRTFVDGPGFILDGVSAEGNEAITYDADQIYRLGWTLPDGLELKRGKTFTLQFVNNSHLRVISAGGYRPRGLRRWGFYVFDKAAAVWSKLELSGGKFSLRAFHHWLVTEEIYYGIPPEIEFERMQGQRYRPFLSAASRMRHRKMTPTGQLRLYNARTKELIVHDTGEPNSEVLFIDENDRAYYRVSDELRLAQIDGGELARPEVLVKSPVLWAVHWLVFGEE